MQGPKFEQSRTAWSHCC